VLAALRDPALKQEHDEGAQVREALLEALSPQKISGWQSEIESDLRRTVDALPVGRPVDLVEQVLQPWTLNMAMRGHSPLLRARVVRRLWLRKRQSEKSLFVGISETLPAFLANAWLALLEHPQKIEPEMIPKAVEELLRHAGLVHSLARVDATGEKISLKLAEANRDPDQFAEPERFDVARKESGHLALGAGVHTCPGATLIRMACAVAVRVFLEQDAKLAREVEWQRGDTLASPKSLWVNLRS
jgi:cytochrome P450